MRQKRRPMTLEIAREWAELAQISFIDALSTCAPMSLEQIAFHGGTNLHLSWGSPRFSEDLDFLVGRGLGASVREVMPRIQSRMQVMAAATDPDLQVTITDKTKGEGNLLNFRIVLSSPLIMGQVMTKVEFWQVEADYMKDFETKFVKPVASGDVVTRISQPLPAATRQAAFADKVVALGYRPHLKWRDLFDIWWLSGQEKIQPEATLPRILHHASAYRGPEGASLSAGLRRFLDLDPAEIAAQADPDLKRWLPSALWDVLNPKGVREIVAHVREVASEYAQRLEEIAADAPALADAALETENQTEVEDACPCP